MGNGYVYYSNKVAENYVWPVRGGQHWSLDPLVIRGAVDFGTVSVGTTSPGHPFTLKNSGTSSLTVASIALNGTDSGQFTLATGGTNPCSGLTSLSLAGGASCTVLVAAKPASTGNIGANLTISSGGLSVNVPLTVKGEVRPVTYNDNGSTSGVAPVDSNNYTSGATVTVLDNSGALAKNGYIFNGWNTTADGSGTSYQPGATFSYAAPVTLYVQWLAPIAPPSGLMSWWRGEGNVVDSVGGNTGTANFGTGIVTATAAENATATATCDSGKTIVSYSSTYGAGSSTISCGSCTIGANSCSVTYSNANCTDPASGTAKSGTLSLTCTDAFSTGKVGQAIRFNGSSEYVTQGKTYKGVASSSANSSFTMEFWAKPTATITNLAASQTTSGYAGTSGQRYAIFPEMQDSTTEAGAGVSVGTNGIMVTEHAGDYLPAPLVYPLVDGDVPSDDWLHIAVVYESQTPKLYVNGVLKQTGLSSGRTVYPSSQFGGTSYGFYSGLLDELHIFNRALTVTEIQSIYNAGPAGLALTPTVTAITPTSGSVSGGTTVTITGSNLTGATAVKFGSTAATSFTFNSDTRITATAPAMAAGTVDVTVTTAGGVSATGSADQFTYIKIDQTISFGTAPTIRVGGNGAVSATASSGLVVSFSSQTPSVCTVSGAAVTGIAEGTCTIIADQAGNSSYSPAGQQTQSFEIVAAVAPTVSTTAATAITGSGATLNATVNANYSSAVVSFEYGTTIAYGSIATASPSPVSGGTPTAIAATISGLTPGSTYHFRVKAVNVTTGTVYGEDLTFTTTLPRFVDLNDGTILDTTNSLRWLKNAQCTDGQGWADAQTWSNSLASGLCGLNDRSAVGDWHLPTIDELQTLVAAPDSYRYDTLVSAGFVDVRASYYWSSTTNAGNADYAWNVFMNDGHVGSYHKTSHNYYVWPVRAGQYWHVGSLVVLGNGGFSALPTGSVSSSHQITLKNVGIADLPVTLIALSGADPDQFSVVAGGSSPCVSLTPTLAAGASCTVMVSATPTTVGDKTASLSVTTAVGSTAVPLTVTASYSGPSVTGISPANGFADGGTTVTITGTNLTGATAVKFGATNATGFSVDSDTQVNATSPAGAVGQIVDITVTTSGGTSAISSADQFTYTLQFQAKNQTNGLSYSRLADAILSAATGSEIRAYAGLFSGVFAIDKAIYLKGGYNMAFSTQDGLPTALNGGMTVTGGAAKVDKFMVKGILTIKNGSLQVNGVVVVP